MLGFPVESLLSQGIANTNMQSLVLSNCVLEDPADTTEARALSNLKRVRLENLQYGPPQEWSKSVEDDLLGALATALPRMKMLEELECNFDDYGYNMAAVAKAAGLVPRLCRMQLGVGVYTPELGNVLAECMRTSDSVEEIIVRTQWGLSSNEVPVIKAQSTRCTLTVLYCKLE